MKTPVPGSMRETDSLQWLLGTFVRKIANLAYPTSIFPWHGTRLREKGNVFLSLLQRKSLNHVRKTGVSFRSIVQDNFFQNVASLPLTV